MQLTFKATTLSYRISEYTLFLTGYMIDWIMFRAMFFAWNLSFQLSRHMLTFEGKISNNLWWYHGQKQWLVVLLWPSKVWNLARHKSMGPPYDPKVILMGISVLTIGVQNILGKLVSNYIATQTSGTTYKPGRNKVLLKLKTSQVQQQWPRLNLN